MTIGGWIIFGVLSFCIVCIAVFSFLDISQVWQRVGVLGIAVFLILALLIGEMWYFKNTASRQRALVDQKSNLAKGMERTITVYTADGEIIAQYSGRIDIEGNASGYVLFDFEGKRYTYHNCFVESVAEID